jgi:hypothetical protein
MIGYQDITHQATTYGFTADTAKAALPGYRVKIEDGHLYVAVASASKAISLLKIRGTAPAKVTVSIPTTVSAAPVASAAKTTHRCQFCGGTWAVTKVHDMSGIPGWVCGRHVADFNDGLGSFA